MKILLLGSTGSIGKQAIEVINNLKYKLCGISYYNNVDLAIEQINKYQIDYYFSPINDFNSNVKSYDELINKTEPDLIINAISGYEGLKISLLCITNYKIDIALANKESLVMGGFFINQIIKNQKINLYPIDSEHSSLYDLIKNDHFDNINKLMITCSGGRYYHSDWSTLDNITYNEAIKHPNWDMGNKISIDSATLMNKCFEIVEAFWLFGINNIIALYHPQSIVHSLVEFKDHSIFANMSKPDMKIAIERAILKFNDNKKIPMIEPLKFNQLSLTFDYIDINKWKPIKWAYEIINDTNHNLGIIINVLNDLAINKFKNKELKFNEIISYIDVNKQKYLDFKINDINDIFELIDLIVSKEK